MFQNGSHCEVFSAQGKEPLEVCKISSNVKRVYDKEAKSYIVTVEGSGAKFQLPKDGKTLGLVQYYLVLQIQVSGGNDFSIEIGLLDTDNNKRRLHLSTIFKESSTTTLHSKMPLGMMKRGEWVNLCFDLKSLVSFAWRGYSFKITETITISSNCKLRRIFTMKNQPFDDTGELPEPEETCEQDFVPKSYVLAPNVKSQVINMARVRYFEGGGRIDETSGSASHRHSISIEQDLNSSGGRSQASDYHIAFGSKVTGSSRVEPRKGSGREGSASSRQNKSSHSRTKSDGGNSDGQSSSKLKRPPSKDRLTVEGAKGQSQRERKNSDPGTNTEDPEITVDKESLRTSHTWTDGADNKEDIPFVKPHPPRQPSSASEKRRKPRVKSAGKERSAGRERTKHSGQKEGGPSPQSSHSSHNLSHQSEGRVPKVATDDEVAMYMKEMQQNSHPEVYRSESESDMGSNNSSAIDRDANDSLTEVINTLNDGRIEYAEEEDDKVADNIYVYHSKPKRLSSPKHARRSYKSKHPNRRRGVETRLEGDFVRSTSTDEEDSQRFDKPMDTELFVDTTHQQQGHPPAPRNGGVLHFPAVQQLTSPKNSQSRVSVNKSSLREIPQDIIRKSGGAKPYEAQRYAMADLSESFEAAMLNDMKREVMEDGLPSDDEADNPNRPKGLSRSKINYGDDDDSDSSDDTATSTLKGAQTDKNYNYHNEMGILSQEFLTQSNPRDWGNVFSPPIVLPSNLTSPSVHTRGDVSSLPSGVPGKSHYDSKAPETVGRDEDKLELLFDPVLNVYFDPKTKVYYELKP